MPGVLQAAIFEDMDNLDVLVEHRLGDNMLAEAVRGVAFRAEQGDLPFGGCQEDGGYGFIVRLIGIVLRSLVWVFEILVFIVELMAEIGVADA